MNEEKKEAASSQQETAESEEFSNKDAGEKQRKNS